MTEPRSGMNAKKKIARVLVAIAAACAACACRCYFDPVSPFNDPGAISYPATVQGATGIQVDGDTARGIAGERSWYCFAGKRDSLYYVNLTADGNCDLIVVALLPDTQIVKHDGFSSPVHSICFVPSRDETCYVRVSRPGSTGAVVSYSLVVQSLAGQFRPDAYEPDNNRAQAKTVSASVDSASQNHTLTRDDTDWIKVNMIEGRTYSVASPGTDSLGNAVEIALTAIDSSTGNNLSAAYGFNRKAINCTRNSVTYFMLKYPAMCRYRLTVTSVKTPGLPEPDIYEPDNTMKQASFFHAISDTQKHTLTLNDTDWIGFHGEAGKIYFFVKLTAPYYTPNNFYLRVSDSAGHFIDSTAYGNITTYCFSSQDYYYQISGDPCSYAMIMITDTMQGWVTPDAYEPDNTFKTASLLLLDSLPQARTITPRDTDVIRIHADSGRYYSLHFTVPPHTNVVVYDSSAALVSSANDGDNALGLHAAYAGWYYVRVYNSSWNAYGKYTIAIVKAIPDGYFSDDEYEPDNTMATASFMQSDNVNRDHSFSFNENGSDSDWVRISADSGKTYYFTIQPLNICTVQLLTSSGNPVPFSSNSSAIWFDCSASGSYFLCITPVAPGGTGLYSIRPLFPQ
jgi:hypothetical protein